MTFLPVQTRRWQRYRTRTTDEKTYLCAVSAYLRQCSTEKGASAPLGGRAPVISVLGSVLTERLERVVHSRPFFFCLFCNGAHQESRANYGRAIKPTQFDRRIITD